MRESIGGAWILSIVIVFMSIFIAYISISINYSNAYKLKTAMVTKLEQFDGFNQATVNEFEVLMSAYSYRQSGSCKLYDNETVYGVVGDVPTANPTTKQNYCVRREIKSEKDSEGKIENKYYYTIDVFFGFNLPVLGELYTFKVSGETNAIYYPATTDYFNKK